MLLAPSQGVVEEDLGDIGAAPGDVKDGLTVGVLRLGPDSMVVVASLKVRAEGFGDERASQEFQEDVVAFGTGAQVSPEIGAGLEEILRFSPALLVETVSTHAACDSEDFLQVVQQLWSWVVRQLLPLAVMKVWHISVVRGRQMNSLHQGPRETLSDWTIGYHPGKGDWCRIASFVGNHCICSSVGVQVLRCLKRLSLEARWVWYSRQCSA